MSRLRIDPEDYGKIYADSTFEVEGYEEHLDQIRNQYPYALTKYLGEQLLKQYFKAQETVESGYFQNRGFVRLEKGIEQFLLKGNPYPDADTTNMLDISMIEFYRYATNVIRALETKDEFKDMQDFEKEDYFFEKMIEKQQKLKRDLEAYSMADLDMESETQEKIDVTKSKNKKNIYED